MRVLPFLILAKISLQLSLNSLLEEIFHDHLQIFKEVVAMDEGQIEELRETLQNSTEYDQIESEISPSLESIEENLGLIEKTESSPTSSESISSFLTDVPLSATETSSATTSSGNSIETSSETPENYSEDRLGRMEKLLDHIVKNMVPGKLNVADSPTALSEVSAVETNSEVTGTPEANSEEEQAESKSDTESAPESSGSGFDGVADPESEISASSDLTSLGSEMTTHREMTSTEMHATKTSSESSVSFEPAKTTSSFDLSLTTEPTPEPSPPVESPESLESTESFESSESPEPSSSPPTPTITTTAPRKSRKSKNQVLKMKNPPNRINLVQTTEAQPEPTQGAIYGKPKVAWYGPNAPGMEKSEKSAASESSSPTESLKTSTRTQLGTKESEDSVSTAAPTPQSRLGAKNRTSRPKTSKQVPSESSAPSTEANANSTANSPTSSTTNSTAIDTNELKQLPGEELFDYWRRVYPTMKEIMEGEAEPVLEENETEVEVSRTSTEASRTDQNGSRKPAQAFHTRTKLPKANFDQLPIELFLPKGDRQRSEHGTHHIEKTMENVAVSFVGYSSMVAGVIFAIFVTFL